MFYAFNRFLILFIVKFVSIRVICGQDLNEDNHWNISDWWTQNKDFEHRISNLVFEESPRKSADIKSGDLLGSGASRFDSYERSDEKRNGLPRSSTKSIRDTIEEHFTQVRSHLGDKTYYRKIKRNLKQHFVDLGLTTAAQSFWPTEMVN